MIDKNGFKRMLSDIEKYDERREGLIKVSREVIKISKRVIYSIQRNDLGSAEKEVASIKKKVKELKAYSDLKQDYTASYRVAEQEFVEAVCLYEIVKNNKLPTDKELNVDVEHYLLGLCDLTGELVRKAINAATKGNNKEALKLKDFVSDLYNELLQFDFRNSDLRRKFDGMKYDLKKLEDLALQLKLKK